LTFTLNTSRTNGGASPLSFFKTNKNIYFSLPKGDVGDTNKVSGHISTPSTGFERDKPAGYPDSSSETNLFLK